MVGTVVDRMLDVLSGRPGPLRRVRIAGRWIREPRRSRAVLRDARRVVAAAGAGRDPDALFRQAQLMVALGRRREAAALLDVLERAPGDPRRLRVLRRQLSGASDHVDPEVLARARAARLRAPADPHRRTRWPSALSGSGHNVEAVVRHAVAPGRTMIRKTLRGAVPLEVMTYTSGLVANGGTTWRAPRVYHVEEEEASLWHVFLEDLGSVRPIVDPGGIVGAARALAELNGRWPPTTDARGDWLGVIWRDALAIPAPRHAERRVRDRLEPSVARRVVRTSELLADAWGDLLTVCEALPVGLSHGDPTVRNVVVRDGVHVLFDWQSQIAPLGSDLGTLLGLPNRPVRRRPELIEACLGACLRSPGISSRPDVSRSEVELAYRTWFVGRGFQRELDRHWRSPDAAWARGVPLLSRQRRLVEANLLRLCEEADRLLAALGRR